MKANWKKILIFTISGVVGLAIFITVLLVKDCSAPPLTNNNYRDYVTISNEQSGTSALKYYASGSSTPSYMNVNPKTIKVKVSPIDSNYTYNEVKVEIKLKLSGKGYYQSGLFYYELSGYQHDVCVEIALDEFGNGETIIDAVALGEKMITSSSVEYRKIVIEYYEIVSSSGEIIALEDELQ